jgi:NADPH2:quinone reductase
MKAVRFNSPGNPVAVLTAGDIPQPVPAHGQVLVRMLASPINPSDLMFIRGQYTLQPECPATPGFEGVGIVEQSGGGLRGRLFRGKRVVVLNGRGGNWAEYTVVPSAQVIPISSSLSVEQAATFFVNPATAWVMTREVLKVPQGEWLVQTAAASSLGKMIVRLGRHCGFRTLNIVRREAHAEQLRALGADHVEVSDGSESSQASLASRLRSICGASGVRFAVDAVGGPLGSAVIQSLGPAGRMLAFGTLSGLPLKFSPRTLMTVGSSVEGFWLGNFMAQKGLLFKLGLVRTLTNLIHQNVLSTEIGGIWNLDDLQAAVTAAEDSQVQGKCLLQFPR